MAPAPAASISDFVNVNVNRVGLHKALFVGRHDFIRHRQGHAFAFLELAAEITQRVAGIQVRVICP